MRSRKVILLGGFVITWLCVTYFYVLRESATFPFPKNGLELQIQHLEKSARAEFIKSTQLRRDFVSILKDKYPPQPDVKLPIEKELSPNRKQVHIVALAPDHPLSLQKPPDVLEAGAVLAAKSSATVTEMNDLTLTPMPPAPPVVTPPAVTRLANGEPVIPIVVFACNRVSITKCLDNLVKYRPSVEQFPIIVSQDCGDEPTREAILSYGTQLALIEQPDQSDIYVPPKEKKFKGYYKIARHYGWALNTTFQRGYEFVVIVEDDLNVAPDFYEYFLGTHSLLQKDPSLWCVSAWNDNGKEKLIDAGHPEILYRTDFFPGLGWMLTNSLWKELSVKWPKSFWDDWIRHPEQRKNRVCIRPEISRTRTFGKIGVSNGLFFDKYLKYIKLSESFVHFNEMNLSYLLKDNYDRTFLKDVYSFPVVTFDELRRNLIIKDGPVRIQYNTKDQYKRTAKLFGLMDDFKSGVPRTGYHGVVSFFYKGRRIFLAPNVNWKGYDLSWS